MPTPDRTTVKAALDAFVATLRTNLAAEPPTPTKPFRRVEAGLSGLYEYARPYLTVRLARARPVAAADGDKILEVTMTMRLVTDAVAEAVHDAVLDKIGAVDDHLDSLIGAGVIDGAEGFDDRSWTIEYPKGSAGSRTIAAEVSLSMMVKVKREQNRVP